MKNLFLLGLLVVTMISCEKQEEVIVKESPQIINTKISNVRYWYDNGGDDYGCKGSGGNCLGDVIVSPIINSAFDVITTRDNSEIASFFEANQDDLVEYIAGVTISKVIDGEYFITQKGVNVEETRYMLFSDEIGKLKEVRPFK